MKLTKLLKQIVLEDYSSVVDSIFRDYPELQDKFIQFGNHHKKAEKQIKDLIKHNEPFFTEELERNQKKFNEFVELIKNSIKAKQIDIIEKALDVAIRSYKNVHDMYDRMKADIEGPQDKESLKQRSLDFLNKIKFESTGEAEHSIEANLLQKAIDILKSK